MKFFAGVIILAIVAGVFCQAPEFSDEMKAKIKQAVDECKAEVNLSAEDAAKVENKDYTNPSENMKCLGNCILEKMGALKDGVVQKDFVLEKLGPIAGEENVRQAIEKCSGIKGANNCDTAFQVIACMKEAKSQILA